MTFSSKQLATLTAILALLATTTSAWATHNPHLGRFMQRDPEGYRDGMNTSAYATGAPVTYVDPSGRTVLVSCHAREQITHGLRRYGVRGYVLKPGGAKDEYKGEKTCFKADGSWSEIAGSMIKSKRVFKIKGDTAKEAILNWKEHIDARRHIVAAAKAKRFSFQTGPIKSNPDLWVQRRVVIGGRFRGHLDYAKDPDDSFSAIEDIWKKPSKYGMACQAGTGIVMLRGISLAMGKGAFNRAAPRYPFSHAGAMSLLQQDDNVEKSDWVPGDWGYVKNTRFVRGRSTVGTEGENIIYMGSNSWWGHAGPRLRLKPLEGRGSWYKKVKGWDGGASILGLRRYPKLGLE